jgi:hypothetical protein
MTNEVFNATTGAAAARRPDYSITDAEVAIIATVMQAAPGSWFVSDFALRVLRQHYHRRRSDV